MRNYAAVKTEEIITPQRRRKYAALKTGKTYTPCLVRTYAAGKTGELIAPHLLDTCAARRTGGNNTPQVARTCASGWGEAPAKQRRSSSVGAAENSICRGTGGEQCLAGTLCPTAHGPAVPRQAPRDEAPAATWDVVPDFYRSWETLRRFLRGAASCAKLRCANRTAEPRAGQTKACDLSRADRKKTFVAAQGRNNAAPAVCARHPTAPAGLRRLKLESDQMAPSRSVASTHHGIGGAAGNTIGAGPRRGFVG